VERTLLSAASDLDLLSPVIPSEAFFAESRNLLCDALESPVEDRRFSAALRAQERKRLQPLRAVAKRHKNAAQGASPGKPRENNQAAERRKTTALSRYLESILLPLTPSPSTSVVPTLRKKREGWGTHI
jgi:hypothetical protein